MRELRARPHVRMQEPEPRIQLDSPDSNRTAIGKAGDPLPQVRIEKERRRIAVFAHSLRGADHAMQWSVNPQPPSGSAAESLCHLRKDFSGQHYRSVFGSANADPRAVSRLHLQAGETRLRENSQKRDVAMLSHPDKKRVSEPGTIPRHAGIPVDA